MIYGPVLVDGMGIEDSDFRKSAVCVREGLDRSDLPLIAERAGVYGTVERIVAGMFFMSALNDVAPKFMGVVWLAAYLVDGMRFASA